MERKNKESINEIKSLSQSLYVSAFWLVILISLFIIFYFSNDYTWLNNLFLASAIYLAIVLFWILTRYGLFEKLGLHFKNFFRGRYSRDPNYKKKKLLKIEDVRRIKNNKSWIGPLISVSIGVILTIVTGALTAI